MFTRQRWGLGLTLLGMLAYLLIFSLKSIANYKSYHMLFDMAVFEQSFWNASQGHFFETSLEIANNHFATHFSPIFFLLLPFYMLKPSATILLILQSLALASAALPLYLISWRILQNDLIAGVIALCYLLTPSIMDINLVNDWHEIAFVVPCLMFAYYFALRLDDGWQWRLAYFGAIGLALMVKEDQAFTIVAFGIWVAVLGHWRIGLLTSLVAIGYAVVVFVWLIPIYRNNAPYVPVDAFPELGTTLPQIISTIFTDPLKVARLITWPAKLGYVQWLIIPLGGLALLAPRVFMVALPALFINLAASNPSIFAVYERYTAPIVPTLFVASVYGLANLKKLGRNHREHGESTEKHRVFIDKITLSNRYGLYVGVALLVGGTIGSQLILKRIPTNFNQEPSAHARLAINIIERIPTDKSLAVADHRALPYATHRKNLKPLDYDSMGYDYLLFDEDAGSVTNVQADIIADIKNIVLRKNNHHIIYQEDGLLLVALNSVYEQDKAYWEDKNTR